MENVGQDGNLNTDKMVRALLTQRNTPDPISKLSPAQILFGRALRDTLPYIKKDLISFENLQFQDQWRNLWQSKEKTMRQQYDKTLITLNEHSRALPPLQINDRVFVQNQHGSTPRKWDRIGVVMEIKPNDQYIVKISGTGRLTPRNRRFLRKIKESSPPTVNHYKHLQHVPPIPTSSTPFCQLTTPTPTPVTPAIHDNKEARGNQSQQDEPASPTPEELSRSPIITPLSRTPNEETVTTPCQPTRQSSRVRKARQFYDPSTGCYTNQNP